MPPRDARQCPDLEVARPADSLEFTTRYQILRQPRLVMFGDGSERQAEVRSIWYDRCGRLTMKLGPTCTTRPK